MGANSTKNIGKDRGVFATEVFTVGDIDWVVSCFAILRKKRARSRAISVLLCCRVVAFALCWPKRSNLMTPEKER